MNCKFICYLILIATIFVSCSKDNIESSNKADALNTQNVSDKLLDSPNTTPEITTFGTEEIDTTYALQLAKDGMISFVNSIRPFYSEGMSYLDLKNSLDPENDLSNMTEAGNNLLFKAYTYIENDTPERNMSGLEAMIALEYMIQNDLNFEISAKNLFGLPDDYEVTTYGDGGCKWYQIGCHLGNLWDWIIGGDDDFSPGDMLKILGIIASLIDLAETIAGD